MEISIYTSHDMGMAKDVYLSLLHKRLGKNIRKFRLNNDYTQLELSEKAELDVTYLSAIEHGKRNITLNVLEKIANALNVEPYLLLK